MAFPNDVPCRSHRRDGEDSPHEALERARGAGIPDERVALDPGIGFSVARGLPGRVDATVLAGLAELEALGRPLCVGVSRKSFLGAILAVPAQKTG